MYLPSMMRSIGLLAPLFPVYSVLLGAVTFGMVCPKFRRSARCETANCIEVHFAPFRRVLVRDSKDGTEVLSFGRAEWAAFVEAAKSGHWEVSPAPLVDVRARARRAATRPVANPSAKTAKYLRFAIGSMPLRRRRRSVGASAG